MALEIDRVLVLSSHHVEWRTAARIVERKEGWAPTCSGLSWTWLFDVRLLDQDDVGPHGLPVDLAAILRLARARGCAWVLLGQDAPICDDLPAHEW